MAVMEASFGGSNAPRRLLGRLERRADAGFDNGQKTSDLTR
jgi:hypothetical protein